MTDTHTPTTTTTDAAATGDRPRPGPGPLTPDFPFIDPDIDIDDDDVVCLSQVQLQSFTASPDEVPPFGGDVTLRWRVSLPSGCRASVRLNGRPVNASGSQVVHPAATTTYRLTAAVGRLTRTLATRRVVVNTAACVTTSVPESLVRSQVRGAVDAIDRAERRLSQRSPARVEIDGRGIELALRFKVAIDNFADPKLNVDCLIGARVDNGRVEPFYKRFSVDLDWPWWVTAITAGVSKIIEEIVEGRIEGQLKPALLEGLRGQIDALVDQIPGNLRLHSLSFVQDAVRLTVCPAGDAQPVVVLATAGAEDDDDGTGPEAGEQDGR